ncbi:hypothetical protein PIROE2DRAFT_12190 [Piromyces sp. E2]|nr:hypothetical protein PIROE2DRAFT_12190 [Piromyces sp. E2]|eukprot:OUM61735.1 hypothetical protein PIROE2DRAFT_12190 [Piromyces sp. E2]
MIRSGTWTMIISACIVDLFSYLFGHDKSFFGILLIIFSVGSFFAGIFLCQYRFKKHLDGIYKRFKQKRIDDRIRYKRVNGIESSYGSEENKSKDGSENEENSIDSYNSNEDNNRNIRKKADKRESESEEESEESEDDSDNESIGSIQLNDRISEKISAFGELKNIMETKELNEPVVVYDSFNEFEIANNEANEAFQLMKELFEESIKQYNRDPYVRYII